MKDFFISHSSLDKDKIVENFVTILEKSGFSIWYDKECILAGDDILKKITEGLNEAYCIIIILTSNFNFSKWGHVEMGIFSTQKRRIIPIICEENGAPHKSTLSFINNLKYLDLRTSNFKTIINELSKALNATKDSNEELVIIDDLRNIARKLNSYENHSASLISLTLCHYLDFTIKYQEYVSVCAKRLTRQVTIDIITYSSPSIQFKDDDLNEKILSLIKARNILPCNIYEYIAFLLSENIDKIPLSNIFIINRAVRGLLRWYISYRYSIASKKIDIDVIPPDQLTRQDFVEMYDIDKLVMREDLIADVDTTYGKWFKANILSHIAIKDSYKNKLIGYCSMFPITEDTHAKILSGDFMDKDFDEDAIRQYDLPSDTYVLYIAGFAIHPNYQQTSAFTILFNAIIDLLLSLAKEREIFIAEVVAEASTKQGEKFCKILKMTKSVQTKYDTNVFSLELIPPNFRISTAHSKILHQICEQKYEENRRKFE